MKILSLKFTNLNSLKGSWHIDFSSDAFMRNGLFAIIGQTGAGKTTILDAICLAIYGQTPRIKQISASQNELMSLGTGECAAQVDIDMAGKLYRFAWQQRRAGNKADGKLQAIRREISRIKHAQDNQGELIETKSSLCDKKAVEIMHMTFEQFTRSVMLAQGNFAAFLKADAGEKGEILEQITGTEIYAKISMQAHLTEKQKLQELTVLQDRLDDDQVMSDDDFFALKASIHADEQALKTHQDQLINIDKHIKTQENKLACEQKIANLTTSLAKYEHEKNNFAPQLDKLHLANKALKLYGTYTHYQNLNEQKTELTNEQHELRQKQIGMQTLLEQANTKQKLANQALKDAKEAQKTTTPLLQEVQGLDTQITQLSQQQIELGTQHSQKQHELNQAKQRLSELTNEQTALKADFFSLQESIQNMSDDDSQDLGVLTALTQEFDRQQVRWQQLSQHTQKNKTKLDALEADIKQKRNAYRYANSQLKNHQQTYSQLQQDLNNISTDATDNLHSYGLSLQQSIHMHTLLYHICTELHTLYQEQSARHLLINEHQNTIKADNERSSQLTQTINTLQQQLAEAENTLIALENNKSLQQEVQILQERLAKLATGEPCPLCGSCEHPYKDNSGHTKTQVDTNIDETITHTREHLKTTNSALQKHTQDNLILQNNINNTANQLATLSAQSHAHDKKINDLITKINTLTQENKLPTPTITPDELSNHQIQIKKSLDQLHQKQQQYQALEPQITQITTLLNQANETCQAIKQDGELISNQITLAKQSFANSQQELDELTDDISQTLGQINHLCHKLGKNTPIITHTNPKNWTAIHHNILQTIHLIKQDFEHHQHAKTKYQELERKLDGLDIHLSNQEQQIQTLSDDECAISKQLQTITEQLSSLQQRRWALFDDKDVENETRQLMERIEQASEQLNQATLAQHQHQHTLAAVKQRQQEVNERLNHLNCKFDGITNEFHQALITHGFNDVAHFLASYLEEADRLSLQNQSDAIDYAIKKTCETLEQEQQLLKHLTDTTCQQVSLSELQAQKQKIVQQERVLLQNLGKNQQILLDATLDREKHSQLTQEIHQKKQDITIWRKLNELIGSADGKKYRNFVQSLTLQLMLHHANAILQRMSERYILQHNTHDKKNLLEINIIDTHQGSEERSTKNLSGGESFIISLALALGLSTMSSENISINSLFLDEGFGTLDEELLDVALSTLSALQDEGKMIGIISHVTTLKERISTQIVVQKTANGTSRLLGLGVHQLAS
ncbi:MULTISPECIES: AAA family ATPase [unclassified Moraxella]|uniref:AAA family ATPase n=1 Tax=unclassified Moraxella TaxID=2685852 RepID=UPI00359D98D1